MKWRRLGRWSEESAGRSQRPQDVQKDHPVRSSFVKRRSSLVAEPAAVGSRDTIHASRIDMRCENEAANVSRSG